MLSAKYFGLFNVLLGKKWCIPVTKALGKAEAVGLQV
jgi:hypothetical protein